MDKILKFIPFSLFIGYSLKLGVLGATSFVEPVVLTILAIISVVYEVRPSLSKFNEQEEKIEKLGKEIKDLSKKYDDLSTHVAGMKLGTQFKVGNVR